MREQFDAFVIEFQGNSDIAEIEGVFDSELGYSYIIQPEVEDDDLISYGLFIIENDRIYQKSLFYSNYMNTYTNRNNLRVFDRLFSVGNIEELRIFLKLLKIKIEGVRSMYSPRILIYD